jgi:flagellar basal-body rod protein FlgG
VQVVQEIVNMITSQRAFEANSKTITAADEMLQTANQIIR